MTDENEYTHGHISLAETPDQRQHIPIVEIESPTSRYTNINRVLVATGNTGQDDHYDMAPSHNENKDNINLQSYSVPMKEEYHLHSSVQFQPYVNSGGLSEDYEYYNII